MGNSSSQETPTGEPVILHVYEGTDNPNLPGFGVFHTGVEVYGSEYVFEGGITPSCGIRSQKPKYLPKESPWKIYTQWTYQISSTLQYYPYYNTCIKERVHGIITEMKPEYAEKDYHITSKNCNHFSDDFCKRLLDGKGIPSWVNRAAKVGNAFKGVVDQFVPDPRDPQQPDTKIAPLQAVAETSDLSSFIEVSKIGCLNQHPDHPVNSLFVKSSSSLFAKKQDRFLQSDADEQLLVFILFKQNVKIHSIQIAGPEVFVSTISSIQILQDLNRRNGGNENRSRTICKNLQGKAPKSVKLYCNKPNMDFEDTTSVPASQQIVLTPELVEKEGTPVMLKPSAFQNVNSLTIFIENNMDGGDTTIVTKLSLIGLPAATTSILFIINVADLQI